MKSPFSRIPKKWGSPPWFDPPSPGPGRRGQRTQWCPWGGDRLTADMAGIGGIHDL